MFCVCYEKVKAAEAAEARLPSGISEHWAEDLRALEEQNKLAEQDLRAVEEQKKLAEQAAAQATNFSTPPPPSGPPPTSSFQMPPPPTSEPPPTRALPLKPKLLLLGKKMPVPKLLLKTMAPRPSLRLILPDLRVLSAPVSAGLARPAGQPKPPKHAPPQHIVDMYVVRHTRNSERIIHVRIL